MGYSVRAGRPADAASLGDIERAAASRFGDIGLARIAEGRPTDAAEYKTLIEAGRLWVAEAEQGAAVGLAIAGTVDGEGYLAEVSVLPGHGRRGLGRRLIETVEAWARAQGFGKLFLTTFHDVAWNRPYYESLGFSVVEVGEASPELRSIRAAEKERGIDAVSPRVCMMKALR